MAQDASGRPERLVIAVLALSGMLTSLQFTLIVPAVPDLPAGLGVTSNDASWVVTVTLLTSTVGTPIAARLADMYGRRLLLLVCLGLLTIGSLIAGIGLTFPTVMVGRALLGFAPAIVPIGMALMRELLTERRAMVGIALMSGTLGIGSGLGLPLSGVLSALGGIGALFWFSAIAGAVFIGLTLLVVPSSRGRSRGRFDATGTVLFALALTSLLLVISKGYVWGFDSSLTICLLAISVVGFAVWIPQQLRQRNPIVDLRTSVRPAVLRTNLASFLVAVGMFANHLLTVHEVRAPPATGIGLGIPAIWSGLLLMPMSVAMIVTSPVAARVLLRVGGRMSLLLGSAIMCAAYTFRLFVHDGIVPVVIAMFLVGVGTSFAFAGMPVLIMDAVPKHETAAANGVNAMTRNLSGAVVGAAVGFLLAVAPWPPDPTFISGDGVRVAFALVAACSGLSMIVTLTLPRRSRGRG